MRDTVLDGVLLRGADGASSFELRAASARGRNHRYEGTVRQDAYAFRCDGRYVVAAVADGVSAGDLSHVAANIVSQHGCQYVMSRLRNVDPDGLDWGEILKLMANKVVTAGRRRLGPDDEGEQQTARAVAHRMSTTVLFAVVGLQPTAAGEYPVRILAHGDTSAWILRVGDSVWEPQLAVKNAGAEVASSATKALPYLPHRPEAIPVRSGARRCAPAHQRRRRRPAGEWEWPGRGVPRAALVPSAGTPRVRRPRRLARRSHDDDRTAVALWPAEPA